MPSIFRALKLQRNTAPSNPSSGYDALYAENTYGRIRLRNSSGVDRAVPFEFFYNVKDYGAVGDGSTNDATAVQAVLTLASVTNPGSTVYFPPGTYLNNSNSGSEWEVGGPCTIYIDKGATVKRGTGTIQYLFKNFNSSYAPTVYAGRSNITFTGGGTVDGNALNNTTSCTLLCFAHCQDILVENLKFRDVTDWHAVEFNSTKNGRILNCTAEGLRLVAANRDVSEAFQIDLAKDSAALPGIGAGAYDNTPCNTILIQGCTVRASANYGAFGCLTGSHSWTAGNPHNNVRIVDNHAEGLLHYMFAGNYYNNVIIKGNTCNDSNAFCLFGLPAASLGTDCVGLVCSDNILTNVGTQPTGAPAVLAYAINVQGLDVNNAGVITNVGLGYYVQDVDISGNVINGCSNGTAAIRALNALGLVVKGGSIMHCTAANTIRLTGCRSGNVSMVGHFDFADGILIEQGTAGTSPPTSINLQVNNCNMDRGTGQYLQAMSGTWGIGIRANHMMSCLGASGTEYILADGPDIIIQNNFIWRREGTAPVGLKIGDSANTGRIYISDNEFKGFTTATSTAASGVSNTAVWQVNGTASMSPSLSNVFSLPTNGNWNNYNDATN